jgi:hypothetical protein
MAESSTGTMLHGGIRHGDDAVWRNPPQGRRKINENVPKAIHEPSGRFINGFDPEVLVLSLKVWSHEVLVSFL